MKTVNLDDIDAYVYKWLTSATEIASSIGSIKPTWVKSNQNSPVPPLPYGTWYIKELTNIGHRDSTSAYNDVDETLEVDNYAFYTFSVEITALGYGSNGLMTIISQYFDSNQFAFDAEVAGIGYQTHGSSQDISAVADAEVREARQFTVTFNCVMKLSEITGLIKRVTGEGTISDGNNDHLIPFDTDS